MNKEDLHERRLKEINRVSGNTKDYMIIQEDYISYLEGEIEKLSEIKITEYILKNPRS